MLDECPEAGIGVAGLVRKEVEDSGLVGHILSFREPCEGILRERDVDVFLGFLHSGLDACFSVLGYLDFAPGEFVDVGVAEAAEATEQECLLDVILRRVVGVDDGFNLL